MKAQNKTVKAVVGSLALDRACNHAWRQAGQDNGVDLMTLHTLKKGSTEYLAECIFNRDEALASAHSLESSLLIVNGVANWVKLNTKTGYYVRNENGLFQTIVGDNYLVGNVDFLKELYGAKVSVLSKAALAHVYSAVDCEELREIGTRENKRTVQGRVIAVNEFGDGVLINNSGKDGALIAHNFEGKRNTHNRAVVSSLVRTISVKK